MHFCDSGHAARSQADTQDFEIRIPGNHLNNTHSHLAALGFHLERPGDYTSSLRSTATRKAASHVCRPGQLREAPARLALSAGWSCANSRNCSERSEWMAANESTWEPSVQTGRILRLRTAAIRLRTCVESLATWGRAEAGKIYSWLRRLEYRGYDSPALRCKSRPPRDTKMCRTHRGTRQLNGKEPLSGSSAVVIRAGDQAPGK